jgi:hypothetical protein
MNYNFSFIVSLLQKRFLNAMKLIHSLDFIDTLQIVYSYCLKRKGLLLYCKLLGTVSRKSCILFFLRIRRDIFISSEESTSDSRNNFQVLGTYSNVPIKKKYSVWKSLFIKFLKHHSIKPHSARKHKFGITGPLDTDRKRVSKFRSSSTSYSNEPFVCPGTDVSSSCRQFFT